MLLNPYKAGGEGVLEFQGTEIQRRKGETEIPNGRGRQALGKETGLERGDLRPETLDQTSAPSWPVVWASHRAWVNLLLFYQMV